MTVTLQNLIDDGLLVLLEGKALMEDAADPEKIQGNYFAVDLTVPTITFGPESDAPVVARAGWIGSCTPQSWMWGWNNINHFPDPAVADAELIRRFGTEYGVAELTTPQIPLLEGGQRDTVWKLAAVATVICGRRPLYFAATSQDAYGVLLVDHPDMVPSTPPTAPRLARMLGEAAQLAYVENWPRALGTYASLRGIPLAEENGVYHFALPEDQHLTVELNERGLVKTVTMKTGYTGPDSLKD